MMSLGVGFFVVVVCLFVLVYLAFLSLFVSVK